MNRNRREKQTVRLMIAMFCRGRHETRNGLCSSCRELVEYAEQGLDKCPHQKKPKCITCKVHCFDNDHRKRIREVMRYAGPRMLFTHPLVVLLHQLGMSE